MFDQRLWKCVCGACAAGGITSDSDYSKAADEIVVRLKLAPPEDDIPPTGDYSEINRRMTKALERDGDHVRFADVAWESAPHLSLIWVLQPGAELLPLNNWDHSVDNRTSRSCLTV